MAEELWRRVISLALRLNRCAVAGMVGHNFNGLDEGFNDSRFIGKGQGFQTGKKIAFFRGNIAGWQMIQGQA